MYVTKEQIRRARKVNLADYLLQEYPADVKIVGGSLCLRKNTSLYVKKSVPGYHDFATGEHGNSVDFLTRYLNFSFIDAVNALCSFDPGSNPVPERECFTFPLIATPPFRKVTAYLMGRGIPEEMIRYLIQERLLYQDEPYGNAVFITPEKDYCEIRGTGSKSFHGCRKKASDRFWYFLTDPKPEKAYVCEAAIDAVSLMLIHRNQGQIAPSAYVSIGGVANQQAIDRLKRKISVVLAVDNDPAGDECRKRNLDLPVLIPTEKDWNDDLKKVQIP